MRAALALPACLAFALLATPASAQLGGNSTLPSGYMPAPVGGFVWAQPRADVVFVPGGGWQFRGWVMSPTPIPAWYPPPTFGPIFPNAAGRNASSRAMPAVPPATPRHR